TPRHRPRVAQVELPLGLDRPMTLDAPCLQQRLDVALEAGARVALGAVCDAQRQQGRGSHDPRESTPPSRCPRDREADPPPPHDATNTPAALRLLWGSPGASTTREVTVRAPGPSRRVPCPAVLGALDGDDVGRGYSGTLMG